MLVQELQLVQELKSLDTLLLETEKEHDSLLEQVHPAQLTSARNLLHYLKLRSLDIRKLQDMLHENGLSTLAFSEGYVRSQILAVMDSLGFNSISPPCSRQEAMMLRQERSRRLFGKEPDPLLPWIMVTFKTSFAHDFITVKKLLKAGMNVARINCAHDNEETWLKMVKRVRETSEFTGLPCKIYMDLAGPKIRTRIKGKKGRIELEEQDIIILSDDEDKKSRYPVVGCTIPGIAAQLHTGERVLFDDGLIETRVVGLKAGNAELEVLRVSSKKSLLKAEKGINFPDSQLQLSALTEFDRRCLPFIMEHADLVGFSFVHQVEDIDLLKEAMKEKPLPIIIKIETPEAYKNLPHLLFRAMREEYFGVMIARGDLAVEIGFEQMGDAQEEILSICQAGHVPVIFATQVLENMNKLGIATRAEVTDAAFGMLADCILVNKGPHTAQVIRALKNILQQRSEHFYHHRPVYRKLNLASEFLRHH